MAFINRHLTGVYIWDRPWAKRKGVQDRIVVAHSTGDGSKPMNYPPRN